MAWKSFQQTQRAVSTGTVASTRLLFDVPVGAQSWAAYAFREDTRALVSSQAGFFDGTNDWLIITATLPSIGGLAPFSNRILYVQPAAALANGIGYLVGCIWQVPG